MKTNNNVLNGGERVPLADDAENRQDAHEAVTRNLEPRGSAMLGLLVTEQLAEVFTEPEGFIILHLKLPQEFGPSPRQDVRVLQSFSRDNDITIFFKVDDSAHGSLVQWTRWPAQPENLLSGVSRCACLIGLSLFRGRRFRFLRCLKDVMIS